MTQELTYWQIEQARRALQIAAARQGSKGTHARQRAFAELDKLESRIK